MVVKPMIHTALTSSVVPGFAFVPELHWVQPAGPSPGPSVLFTEGWSGSQPGNEHTDTDQSAQYMNGGMLKRGTEKLSGSQRMKKECQPTPGFSDPREKIVHWWRKGLGWRKATTTNYPASLLKDAPRDWTEGWLRTFTLSSHALSRLQSPVQMEFKMHKEDS